MPDYGNAEKFSILNTVLDALLIEKTDGNEGAPDGGIVIVNAGSHGATARKVA